MNNTCQGFGTVQAINRPAQVALNNKQQRYFFLFNKIPVLFKRIAAMFIAVSFTALRMVYAAPVTQNYVSAHAVPLYQNAPYMPYANPNAPKGGMLSQSAIGTFDNFQTLNGKGTGADGTNYLYDTLMQRSLNEPAVNYPLLATSVTIDPNDLSYAIFHLNPKARFSDGSPVQAEDVVFSFNAIAEKGAPGLRVYLSDIKKVTALSKLDVRFDYKAKDNAEITSIVSEVAIYSKKDFVGKDYGRVMAKAPLGSGPYLLDKVDAGRAITYKRNPNYWGKDVAVNKGKYNFDFIKYVYYRDLDIAFEGFKAGQFFYQTEYKARTWSLSYDFPAVKQNVVLKQIFKTENPVPTQTFVMNLRHPVFQDIRLRQALTYAYDFEWLNKALFFGLYERLQSFFYGSELAATGKPSSAELKILAPLLGKLTPFEREGVLSDWKYSTSDAGGFNRNNLLIAHRILHDAGYRSNAKGELLDKQGKPIRIEFLTHQDNLARTILPFIRNLKRLGIEVKLTVVDVPQYIERVRKFDYDMIAQGIPQSISPGNEQMQFWSSLSADQEGNYNFAGIKNPVIDQVIDGLIRAPDRTALIDYTRVLDRLLRAGYYVIPTYSKVGDFIATWNMYEQPKNAAKYDKGIDYWWVNPEKAARVNRYLSRQQKDD